MALQHLRSSTADKRPTPAAMSDGQLALNTNLASPGLFFKDSNGDSVKIGPVHVGTTAPNATPGAGGQAGNSKGEQWLDTSSSRYVFKIWDGTAWRTEDGEFVNASGDTMTGALVMDNQQQVRFRETTANGTNFIAIEAPASVTADRTLTLPDATGTIVSTGDTGSVTSTMIFDGTIMDVDINASAAIADTKLAIISTAGKVSGTAITSGNINTSGSINTTGSVLVSSNSPALKLEETDGTSTHNRSWIVRDSNAFSLQTRNSADAFVSTDYFMPTDASGATSHVWRIAGAEEARLTGTGLGIGTSVPSHRLEVARLGADLAITGVDANTAILVTPGGGTTTSGSAITIAAGTAANSSIFFGDTADGDIGGIIYGHVDNSLNFRTNGTNIAQFNSTGQLLLGGITPQTAVAYSICTTGRIESDATYSNTTAAAANMVVDVNGIFIRSTSSIKYKTDVEDAELSYSESLVFNSRPVWYRSLSESDPSEYSYWGFIAEEVAEIDPRMVHWGNDGPEGVQYDRYVVHLVNVIQKQKQQLDAIEARIAALEAN